MSRTCSRLPLRSAVVAISLVATLTALTGCSAIDGLTGNDDPAETPSASPNATETPYDSQFTRDGTFQSHIDIDDLDFVYTLYPTKSTPRTNEWYPKGKKFFSFTFQAYDLDRDLRDPFRTKRKVYLDRIVVTSQVTLRDGSRSGEEPYSLDAVAKNVTFDPEPVSTKHGMLITSPKGAFELRNQPIRPTSMDTKGIDLFFTATVWMEQRAGTGSFVKKKISQKVPIAIFESDEPTEAQSIPVDAN
ncbi:hypothetical protein [Nocardioides sp. YIM 152315]|uniref:hypothetical protein n=1 Tax=Nocardioides sp. YIM 152315 TaxID=3031760 RepID=UPI0023DB7AC4|nr:hypothetical protein [Nocardioides sp. YIM 152315]MDF1602975.1 hypothetical protein [Nocardioides sp. YIM 152315]